jgi:hypothetical protein
MCSKTGVLDASKSVLDRCNTMICPECQTVLPVDSRFCKECGRKLDLTCSECSKSELSDSKFRRDIGQDFFNTEDSFELDSRQLQFYTSNHLAD